MKKIVLAVALFAVTITVSAQDQTVNGNLSVSGNTYVSKTLEIKGQPYMGSLKSEIIHSGSLHIRTAENSSSSAIIDLLPGLLDTTQVARINFYKATSLKSYKKTAMINSIGSSFFNGGYVGIGTETPQYTLDVNGTTRFTETAIFQDDVILRTGTLNHIPIGTYSKKLCFGIGDNTDPMWIAKYNVDKNYSDLRINIGDDGDGEDRFVVGNIHWKPGVWKDWFVVNNAGKVGIGVSNPQYPLDVNGTIHAKEVLIDTNFPLADYVFKPDYKLMPLNELEQFVQSNSHLPEIPSAEEVAKKGLSIGEMQNKLLQKIEELTLYMIEQNKKIEQQNKEIESLKSLINK